jgi:hypothetical protein
MTKINLKNVRLSFPHLYSKEPAFKKTWEAMTNEERERAKYTATFLLDKNDAETKREIDLALNEIVEKHKYKKLPSGEFLCVKDGDTVNYDGYENTWSIKSGNKKRPLLIDRDKTPLTAEDDKFYPGCYVNAVIDFYGYNYKGDAINANLYGIQFVKDGEPFEKRTVGKPDDFEDLDEL